MASTATTGLRLELIADGEASNTWGLKTNTNLAMLDRSVSGYIVYPVVDGNNTLSATDYLLADWHNMGWKLTGALTADAALRVPAFEKVYIVENATTGAFTLTVKTVSGTGVIVPQGQRALLLCDGTNVVGTILQSYSANTSSIAAIASPGFLTRKSDGTWVPREIQGTAEQITVTQGFGDASNPTLSLNTTLVAPGTVRVTSGLTVSAGGATVSAGGLTVVSGGGRFSGANAAVTVASNSGFGGIEVSGPSGATLDLKDSESEDFDIRLLASGSGGWMISNGVINLQTNDTGQTIQHLVGSTVVCATTLSQAIVYVGKIRVQVNGNNDSRIEFANSAWTYDVGIRGGGAFSIRSNNQDALTIGPDRTAAFTNSLTVSTGSFSVLAGNVFAAGGSVNFSNMTSFTTKGFSDDAQTTYMWLRNSGNLGLNASVPQTMLHLGNLGLARNSAIRVETGGPAGFRGWDVGTNYGEFTFYITDVSAGARRFTIATNGRTQIDGGLTVNGGTVNASNGLAVSNGATLAGGTTLSKAGGSGHSVIIQNSGNNSDNGCQVFYNGTLSNVFTRVAQSSGSFEFVNTNYGSIMLSITQAGAAFNATGTYGTLSDIRLKEHVADARDYTDDLMKLRVVDYALLSDGLGQADKLGFVAQEVREVLPELVVDTGNFQGLENALAVSTSNMIPMIVKAIQGMNRRLENLEHA